MNENLVFANLWAVTSTNGVRVGENDIPRLAEVGRGLPSMMARSGVKHA